MEYEGQEQPAQQAERTQPDRKGKGKGRANPRYVAQDPDRYLPRGVRPDFQSYDDNEWNEEEWAYYDEVCEYYEAR